MEILVYIVVIVLILNKLVSTITMLVDELIKLKTSLHKLRNHPDGRQSDSINNKQ